MQLRLASRSDDVTIILKKAGETKGEIPTEFFASKLLGVSVVRLYTTTDDKDSGVLEQITFDCRKIHTFYQPTKDGTKGAIKEFCYDVQANIDC